MVLWKNSCSPNLEKLFFSWREYFLTKKAKKNFIYDIGDIKGNSQHLWINITNKEGFECKKRAQKKRKLLFITTTSPRKFVSCKRIYGLESTMYMYSQHSSKSTSKPERQSFTKTNFPSSISKLSCWKQIKST